MSQSLGKAGLVPKHLRRPTKISCAAVAARQETPLRHLRLGVPQHECRVVRAGETSCDAVGGETQKEVSGARAPSMTGRAAWTCVVWNADHEQEAAGRGAACRETKNPSLEHLDHGGKQGDQADVNACHH